MDLVKLKYYTNSSEIAGFKVDKSFRYTSNFFGKEILLSDFEKALDTLTENIKSLGANNE